MWKINHLPDQKWLLFLCLWLCLDLIPSCRFHKLSPATTVGPDQRRLCVWFNQKISCKIQVYDFFFVVAPTSISPTFWSFVSPQADAEEWAGRMPVPTRCRWISTVNRLVSLQSSRRRHTALIMCWFWCFDWTDWYKTWNLREICWALETSYVHKWCH